MSRNNHLEMTSPISFWANVARLPQKGMPVDIVADDTQRAALAEAHELLSVESLKARMLVVSWKRNGIRVTGRVTAEITQACIVTLDPVAARIDEDFEALYLPEDSKLGRHGFEGGGEIVLDFDGADSPETFSGDSIDVGALAEQYFSLAIDPYPRKADAHLEIREEPDAEAPKGPLADKLAALARKS